MKTHGILRRGLALCASLIMMCGTCETANAEDLFRSGWDVSFTGSAIESNFKPADVYDVLCELLPGDSATVRIDLKNTSDQYVQWYMSNETLQTLEDTRGSARDGGYGYRLSYTSGQGASNADKNDPGRNSVVLFESDMIGGEGAGKDGLYEATESLDEFFQLCTMAPGGSGYVTLYVKLDGETQGNGYQSTLARLRMVFAVDTVPVKYVQVPGEPTKVTVQDPPTVVRIPGDPVYVIPDSDTPLADIPTYTQVPQTGDTLMLAAWSSAAMLLGACGIVVLFIKRRKAQEGGAA